MRHLVDTLKEWADATVAGNYAKALELLIWIHDNPNPADPISEMLRRDCGFHGLGLLAKHYEPAKAALVRLVAVKRDRVAAGTADDAMQADLRSLEEMLRDAEGDA
jgi:hypothetical protein